MTFGILICLIHFCPEQSLAHNRCLINIIEWPKDLILPSLSLLPSPTCSLSSSHRDLLSVPPTNPAHAPFGTFPSVWNTVVPITPPQALSFIPEITSIIHKHTYLFSASITDKGSPEQGLCFVQSCFPGIGLANSRYSVSMHKCNQPSSCGSPLSQV